MPSLRGPRLRVDRASTHLNELERLLKGYIDGKPYHVVNYEDPEKDLFAIEITITVPPTACGLVVGDIVHNLRASLDNLIWQLSSLNSAFTKEKPPFDISFPILEIPDVEQVRQRVRFIPDGAIGFIETVQPYQIGDNAKFHPLLALNRLSNADKHNTIQVTGLHMRMPIPSIPEIPDSHVRIGKDGHIWLIAPLEAREKLKAYSELTADVSLRVPRENFSASPNILWEIRDYIRDNVLSKFAEFLPE